MEIINKRKDINKVFFLMDTDIQDHCIRTSNIAIKIADSIGIKSEVEMQHIKYAALIHDIGKTFINRKILNKKEPLTYDEKNIINSHAFLGYDYLKKNNIEDTICSLVLFHHGADTLEGLGINKALLNPLKKEMAEIIKAADSYDAITSERPYRERAYSHDEAINIMTKEKAFSSEYIEILKNINEVNNNSKAVQRELKSLCF